MKNSVGEAQPGAPLHELARHIAVPGQNGQQSGQAVIGRVGRQQQDHRRGKLQHIEHGPRPKDGHTQLGDNCGSLGGNNAQMGNQQSRATKDGDDNAHQNKEHLLGIMLGGGPEGGDSVAHHLHTGEGGAARGKRLEKEEYRDAPQTGGRRLSLVDNGGEVPHHQLDEAHTQQKRHNEYEGIGRDAEDLGGFPHPPQVEQRDHAEKSQRDGDPVALHDRKGGCQGGNGRRDTHGHRHHIVHNQSRGRHQRGFFPDVLGRDHVGPAPVGIARDDLRVGEGQHQKEQSDGQHNIAQIARRSQSHRRNQHQEHLFDGIGHRGDRVAGHDGYTPKAAQLLLLQVGVLQGIPQQEVLEIFPLHKRSILTIICQSPPIA